MSLLVPLVSVYVMRHRDDEALAPLDDDLNGPRHQGARDADDSCFAIERRVNGTPRISVPALIAAPNTVVMGAKLRGDDERIEDAVRRCRPRRRGAESDRSGAVLDRLQRTAFRRRGVSAALLDAAGGARRRGLPARPEGQSVVPVDAAYSTPWPRATSR